MKLYYTYNLLEESHFLKAIQESKRRIALITDETVDALYGKPLLSFFDQHKIPCEKITFPAGEKHKTRKTKGAIEDHLLAKKFGRDTLLILMGGGVTLDLGGFVAATYCRGVPFLSIPTSLLAMVDASIGGKTGVNVKEGKNMIGAFSFPQALFIDFSMLSTLPEKEMLLGSAEVIKHALIADHSTFEHLEENLPKWLERDMDFLKKVITHSCHVKEKVVHSDPKEQGLRRILNFGHTIGHALEVIEGFTMPHGEAVALGMIVESYLSWKSSHLKEKDFDAIHHLIKSMGFPLTFTDKVAIHAMKEAMMIDKKSKQHLPHFVHLHGIGRVESFKGAYAAPVEEETLDEALGWMIAEFGK